MGCEGGSWVPLLLHKKEERRRNVIVFAQAGEKIFLGNCFFFSSSSSWRESAWCCFLEIYIFFPFWRAGKSVELLSSEMQRQHTPISQSFAKKKKARKSEKKIGNWDRRVCWLEKIPKPDLGFSKKCKPHFFFFFLSRIGKINLIRHFIFLKKTMEADNL